MNPSEGTLLFVYNADSGLFNTVTDIAHKIFSPQTYQCDLCALTHGYFSMRDEWRNFVTGLGVPCEFLHRDQAAAQPAIDVTQLPAVYYRTANQWQRCLGPAEIGQCRDMAALQQLIVAACSARK